ncbi:MAG TPA: hypothetical protein VHI13_15390 [Candidatus Kapabacteria bacterium]|nr:hypothetical protein [Candidatus Kapabacteria bacterium]
MSAPVSSPRLEPCPACGRECSAAAAACPGCGHPIAARQRNEGIAQDTLYSHILNQSSLKVGMCLTLLGLIKVVEGAKGVSAFSDELLAVNAVLFLVANMLTYHAVKLEDPQRRKKFGRLGDLLFTTALCMLASVCAVLAFELI